jgi:hypothetical protein
MPNAPPRRDPRRNPRLARTYEKWGARSQVTGRPFTTTLTSPTTECNLVEGP